MRAREEEDDDARGRLGWIRARTGRSRAVDAVDDDGLPLRARSSAIVHAGRRVTIDARRTVGKDTIARMSAPSAEERVRRGARGRDFGTRMTDRADDASFDRSEMSQDPRDRPSGPPYLHPGMMGMPFPVGAPAMTPEQFQEQYGATLRRHQAQIAHAVAMNAAASANPAYAAQQAKLREFWREQMMEIQATHDFKNHLLPLARIKKIMKSDEDVRMISSEAPVLFAKACEMFVLELTMRAWAHAQENKRRTLQRGDIAAAITKTDIFDFLIDIVPRDEAGEGGGDDGENEGPSAPQLGALPIFPPPQLVSSIPGVPGTSARPGYAFDFPPPETVEAAPSDSAPPSSVTNDES